nr:hypothetical protein [Pseudonocardia abyssalis]
MALSLSSGVDRLAVSSDEMAAAVQDRIHSAAPGQTWAQLSAAIRRAILAVDPDRAAERHQVAREERRVDVFAGEEGMATVWARMSAPDAASSFEWLTRSARGMGADAAWKRLAVTGRRPPANSTTWSRGRTTGPRRRTTSRRCAPPTPTSRNSRAGR